MKTIYITEEQKNNIKNVELLTEARGERALRKYIIDYTNSYIAQFLDIPLTEIPQNLIAICNPGEGESEMFSSVKNNSTGNNKFIDFLRVNFYEQFGMLHNGPTKKYMEGIARIALGELGFYSFDNRLQGSKIVNLGRVIKIISNNEDLLRSNNINLDGNLNNLSYNELMEYLNPVVQEYIDNSKNELNNSVYETPANYVIHEIKDVSVNNYGTPMKTPTRESYDYLESLAPYCDWCIVGNRHPGMYGQYTSNGGKFYICEKEGFENVPREQGENCPLDEYGLSLICVLVAPDGFPENITTRWNHDFNGENNPNLENAIQLQNILKVKYLDIFKPRNEEEVNSMTRTGIQESEKPAAQDQVDNKVNAGIMDAVTAGGTMEEGAEPESDKYEIGSEKDGDINPYYHVNESDNKEESELKKYCGEIANFMKKIGINVYPYPKLNLDWSEQDGLFIKTGFYTPDEKAITIFCKDRHPKDILRTFSHEMIHHSQNLNGKDLNFSSDDDVKDNDRLKDIEAEAYLKGNIYFRQWTEYKNSERSSLNESKTNKKVVNDEGKIVPEKCEKCGGKIGVYICGEPIYKCSECGEYYGTVKFSLKESEIFEETSPDSIDLSSFNIKKELNPKFWKNGLLDSRIRLKLMDIADDFIDFLGIDWVKPDDIIMTGSLANFNWNKKYSDIDLHILIDFSKVDKRKDFVKKYFDSLKNSWNEQHEDLSIFGFPVEVYVQDTNESHTSTGVYSLDKNEWIKEPERKKLATSKVNKSLIRNKVANYINQIDNLEEKYNTNKDNDFKVRKISEKLEKLWDTIKNERKSELNNETGKEISNGNIIFKCLRRLNYIDKLYDLKTKTYDKMNSLP